ncbi:MAG: glycosyltransferase [Pelatocladus maniniholoensis HA4357-MV3]|jgi:glycosyltransferase involved in cell wall biosynthesis|uniref:Glycosyltransferase n=1 Tax=Pelatocladus maniniholoensis HA4357-MV3 TaxID=1117104 RepID=A0A9E3H8V5_9NOST|nr:glycosyltransferase [Pelatocladus maniniholoensis HA4357-MV3]BAZ68248.1 family 2 glycosyl transferase [Fischerella sp. NIES-4106]
METVNDTLSVWKEEGTRLIQPRIDVFRSLIDQTKNLVEKHQYDAAAVYAEIAACYTLYQHCGIFVSTELEHILLTIGQKAIQQSNSINKNILLPKNPKNILHVATVVGSIGGHSRMIWRWIQQDADRSHSLVLTRQDQKEVPKIMKEAVANSQGKIYSLRDSIGHLVSRAKQLRQIAASADLVVLHTSCEDVIPIIAFANKEQSPPIILLNHADHFFWLGVSISDIVANLRESGMYLSQERRGVEAKRNVILPIILPPIHRTLTRIEAKNKLGIDENNILLLSIARSLKYRSMDGVNFAEAHIPLLERHKQAILVVIGPGVREDWSQAIQQAQGRIIVLEEREDTSTFYQAADIYVDSFPFISNTSLLEAGSYGIPLVSRYPFDSDLCSILGADMPGLSGNLMRVKDIEEYTAVLSHLIEDEAFRLSIGEATRKKIAEIHRENWQQALENLYSLAIHVPRVTLSSVSVDEQFLGEPDVFFPYFFEHKNFDIDWLFHTRFGIMPIDERLHLWIRFVRKYGFSRFTRFSWLSTLFPEWMYIKLKKMVFG